MSRIYDAMRRASAQGGHSRLGVSPGPDDTAVLDPIAEGYQRVLQTIQSRHGFHETRSILVVSAIHGEGASTVARGLAALLSRDHPGETLLIDANLRMPSQHRAFGVERGNGLAELATRGLSVQQAVRSGVGTTLPLLTAGRPAGNPTAVLSGSTFRAALAELRSRYAWVIIDGPPATVYTDASILAPMTDGVLLVIQAERTRWEVAEQSKRTLQESGARLLGGVLTRRRYHIPPGLYARL